MWVKVIGTVTVAVLAVGSPAAAAPKRSELTLSYMADAGYAAGVLLRCDPAGGGHPKKGKACQALAKVGGNPAKLKPSQVMCTLEYAPITAEIKGKWRGKKVAWTQKFGNTCEMTRKTGILLAF